MSLLTKKQVLEADDIKFEIIDVPEWGGQVKVKTMSGPAREMFEKSILGKDGKHDLDNLRAKFAAACIVDENDNLLFSAKDLEALGNKSFLALDRIFEAGQRLNILTKQDLADKAKNS